MKLNNFFNKYLHLLISICLLILGVLFIMQSFYCKNLKEEKAILIQNLTNVSGNLTQDYYNKVPGVIDEANRIGGGLSGLMKDSYVYGTQGVINFADSKIAEAQNDYSHYSVMFSLFVSFSAITIMASLIFICIFMKKKSE